MTQHNMRKYINLVEGAYIPFKDRSISMDVSAYELYRLLQKLGSEYEGATDAGSDAIMTFNNPLEYKYFTDILKQHGIKYKDIGQEKEESAHNTHSPVPSPSFRNFR